MSQNHEDCTDSSAAECVGVGLADYIYEVGENKFILPRLILLRT